MNISNRDNPDNAAVEASPTDETRSHPQDRAPEKVRSPGDGKSRERVDARDEEIAREGDSLQSAIEREVNDVIEHGQ